GGREGFGLRRRLRDGLGGRSDRLGLERFGGHHGRPRLDRRRRRGSAFGTQSRRVLVNGPLGRRIGGRGRRLRNRRGAARIRRGSAQAEPQGHRAARDGGAQAQLGQQGGAAGRGRAGGGGPQLRQASREVE